MARSRLLQSGWSWTAGLLIALAWGPTAEAQGAGPQGAGPQGAARQSGGEGGAEQALALGKEGLTLYQQQAWAQAADRFARADAAMHSPVFVLYQARCLRALNQRGEALVLFERVAAESLQDTAPQPWRDAVADARREGEEVRAALQAEEAQRRGAAAVGRADEADALGPIWPGVLAMSVAGVGVLMGALAGGLALAKEEDAKARCIDGVCPEEDEMLKDEALTLAHVSTAGFVLAGVAAVTGTVLLVVRPGGEDAPVEVTLGPAAVGVRGRF